VIIVDLIGEICAYVLMQCVGYVNLMLIMLLTMNLYAKVMYICIRFDELLLLVIMKYLL